MHIASVFLGVTYFMPALDTQIIEEEYKEMLRGVEHLPSSFCWRSRNEEIDGWIIERSPFPVKNVKKRQVATLATPLSLPCLRVNMHKGTWRKYFPHNKRLLHSPALELQPFRQSSTLSLAVIFMNGLS